MKKLNYLREKVLYFKLLGPLEVVHGQELVDLGGTRQRATLGLLLLNPNRVVASSQLMESLWPEDKVPMSARKIVQNSVWRLRKALSADSGGSASLLSQPPGYMLRVDPEQTDVHNFHRCAEAGRAKFAQGDLAAASQLLGEALALWRGPVLVDLVESGIQWPELIQVQNARLDALEDYFEVELAKGCHQQILAEIQRTVAVEPLRERLCGQLMLALYRSGRQTDALNAYYALRTTLVEEIGLEPSPTLRSLQQAILNHDSALIPVGMQQEIKQRMTGLPRDPAEEQPTSADPRPALSAAQPTSSLSREVQSDRRRDAGVTPAPAVHTLNTMVAERKKVSVLIVRCQGMGDTALETAATAIREEVEWLEGSVAASMGSIWLALFGVHETGEDAERAVLAALTIRDRFGCPDTHCAETPIAVYVAVATGEALVRYHPDHESAESVSGVLLDECHGLLSQTPVGEIRVCENTRRATESAVTYFRGGPSVGWQVGGLRQEYLALHDMPVVDREYDLEVLSGLLRRTRHIEASQLVTVLGDPGVGKTRFILEFERRIAATIEPVQILVGRARPFVVDTVADLLNDLLCSYCGIDSDSPAESMRTELAGAVERLVPSPDERRELLPLLTSLADWRRERSEVPVADVLRALRHLIGWIVLRGPVVVIIDDLHVADEQVLDFVEDLPRSIPDLPVLVVVTARPELARRRPMWGSRLRHALTMNLEPISDIAIDRLLEFLRSTRDRGVTGSAGSLLARGGDDSDARRRHVRRVLASGSSLLRKDRCTDGGARGRTPTRVIYYGLTELPVPADGAGR